MGRLVLSRRAKQIIKLDTSDGPVEVCVEKIRGNQVQLSIAAPKEVRVVRAEIAEEQAA